jgi:aryl-alcohol dehydrogenase-like predicted oxidoreductase
MGSYKLGVNFWDTSDDYGSHPHVAAALRLVPRKDVVICTKTSARSDEQAKKSLRSSLKELGTDYVDVFLLHYVTSDWISGSRRVLKTLNDLKTAGIIKAAGLSTHSVKVVKETARFDEADVIMTICCYATQATIRKFPDNIPLEDGSIEEMLDAIRLAHENGKGVVAMKVLGGRVRGPAPSLAKNYQLSIKAIARLGFVDAMVVGMRSLDQVKKNVNAILSLPESAFR